ncbi:Mon2p [Sporobolomyces koalae]|uniref:Mon2p n=1 Tax=Sporobolomyces koalae TaxID=500713 RepID=UPI00317AA474
MSSSAVVALLQADYTALSKEAGRRHSDVRDAADKAAQLVKSSKEQALVDVLTAPGESGSDCSRDARSNESEGERDRELMHGPSTGEPPLLYHPILLASSTRNAKVIALAVSALQRLITAGAVPTALVGQILDTLEQVLPQGVEIQLKILQTLVSLLTTKTTSPGGHQVPLVHGEQLGRALELSHRLSTSKIPVVASTASATLRQLFMFVYDRIVDEDTLVASSKDPEHDPSLPRATFDVDVPPLEEDRAASISLHSRPSLDTALEANNQMRSIKLRPAARDAYLMLEDLCLLIAGSVAGGPDGEPSFLRWGTLSRTFGLELVESIVSGFGPVVRTHPELLLVLRAHLCPLLIRFLSSPPPTSTSCSSIAASAPFSFPLTLRLTRVVFLLLKQFSDLLTLESEVFLTMFVRIVTPAPGLSDQGEGGHPAGPSTGLTSPLWMRVLALEIFRGLCGDFELMIKFYQRYDAQGSRGQEGSLVLNDLMSAFNRLATEKPIVLGTGNAILYGSSLGPSFLTASTSQQHGSVTSSTMSTSNTKEGSRMIIDSAMEMGLGLAHAAGSVVGSGAAAAVAGAASVGLAATGGSTPTSASLDHKTASMKLQCIDQLDKADPPAIPETYIFLLALQCLAALADGFSTYTLTTYARMLEREAQAQGRTVSRAPRALDWTEPEQGDELRTNEINSLKVVKEMAETCWPALLASLSFFISTSLSDDLFTDVVSALQSFTCVCGVLNLSTPREAFLTSLCKFAIPPTVVSHIVAQDSVQSSTKPTPASSAAATATAVLSAGAESLGLTSSSTTGSLPVGLSSRNLACLRAVLAVSHYLAGSLGKTWFSVFEALQNAEFVLKATASKGKRRTAPPPVQPSTVNASPVSSSKGSTATTTANAVDNVEPSKFPTVPTEADEQAIQRAIATLFEVSKALDDGAFKEFVGALCRLNGEMVGIPMNDDGTVRGAGEDEFGTGVTSPIDTPEKSRRRSSGISTKSHKLAEKSFGIAKVGVVALFNVQRLVAKDPALGWNLVTSHLLLVLHSVSIPTSIRLQAADVLDSILILAPKNLTTAPLDVQRRAQIQVLTALSSQADPAPRLQTTTDVDVRRMALESLLKILETNGHAFVVGWDQIFHVLRTACPTSHPLFFAPSSPQPPPVPSSAASDTTSRRSLDTIGENDRIEPMTPLARPGQGNSYFPSERSAKASVLVRTSFPSLQLICSDFLGGLAVDDLRDCIATLAEFGKQAEDVNVALTAGGLLWSVSDHVQAKRRAAQGDDRHGELWMFLLRQLLRLCRDSRQEVRDAAITNIFRSISMYGSTLSKETWEACSHDIIFPLVEDVTLAMDSQTEAYLDDDKSAQTVPQAHGPPIRLVDKQWDDSKMLVLRSMGDVFFEYLSQIVKTDRYEETWSTFVEHLSSSFIRDRPGPATAAMQSLEKVLTVSLESTEAARIASSWEVAWTAWDKIGSSIEDNSRSLDSNQIFTQTNLEAFVRVVLPIYTPPYIAFDLDRINRLLAILKVVLVYACSPDYRADIDGLMPLQSSILEVVAVIKLDEVPGSASAVLSDLSDYLTLAYVAPFEAPPDSSGRLKQSQNVTFIALTKEVMPHVLWLYQKHSNDTAIYERGAIEKMLAAFALPMRLKHECPAPAKFGSAQPLWKTATVDFLKAVRDVVGALQKYQSDLSPDRFVSIWRAIVEGFRGALLAETGPEIHASLDALHEEENFDLSLLLSLEQDVLPFLGTSQVPDELIRSIGKTLQLASRLYELDVPRLRYDRVLAHKRSFASSVSVQPAAEHTPPTTPVEARFDPDFDNQATQSVKGTTVEVIESGRERFAYWSLDLLFAICADIDQGESADHSVERRRIAALCLPYLLNRCAASLKTYVADAPLRGKMPFPRIRQEELVHVLQQLDTIRIREGTLWASQQADPTASADSAHEIDTSLPPHLLLRSILLKSPLAHVYELQPLLIRFLSLAQKTSFVHLDYTPYRCTVGRTDSGDFEFPGLPHGFTVKRTGLSAGSTQGSNVVDLVLSILEKVGHEIGAGHTF